MSVMPPVGTAVVLVQRSAPPLQWQGELVAVKGTTLAVRLNTGAGSLDATNGFSIIWGAPGSRKLCQVTVVASNDRAVALKLASMPKQIDLRRDERFRLELNIEVRSVLGNSRQQGRLIDISAGGAAISVDARPGGSQVEIGVHANGYGARLLCDVINAREEDDQTVLHLRFKDLSPPQQAFVRNLVGWLVEAQAS